jgi:hypothetical protein
VEERSEVVVFKTQEAVSEEIIEDVMSTNWRNSTKNDVIVVFTLEFARKSVVGLVNFHKLLVRFFVIRIIFGMVLEGQLAVGCLDVIKSCCFGDS